MNTKRSSTLLVALLLAGFVKEGTASAATRHLRLLGKAQTLVDGKALRADRINAGERASLTKQALATLADKKAFRLERSAASTILTALVISAPGAEREKLLTQYLTAARTVDDRGLAASILANVEARIGNRGKAEPLLSELRERRFSKQLPLDQIITKKGNRRLIYSHEAVHPEFWQDVQSSYKSDGWKVASKTPSKVVVSYQTKDPKGPLTFETTLVRGEDKMIPRGADLKKFRKADYSGHADLGGNFIRATEALTAPISSMAMFGAYACRTMQSVVQLMVGMPNAQLVVSTAPSYESTDHAMKRALTETIEQGKDLVWTAERAKKLGSDGIHILNHEYRKMLAHMDSDGDGTEDWAGKMPDPLHDPSRHKYTKRGRTDLRPRPFRGNIKEVNGYDIDTAVTFLNTVVFYHADEATKPRFATAAVKDKFVPGSWFVSKNAEATQVTNPDGLYQVAANVAYQGQSRDATAALLIHDTVAALQKKLPTVSARTDAAAEKLRPLLFAAEYVAYITPTEAECNQILRALTKRAGLPAIGWTEFNRILESDDAYASDKQISSLEQLIAKKGGTI